MRLLKNRILLFSVFVLALMALRFYVFGGVLSFERIKGNIDLIPFLVSEHFLLSVIVFIGLFACTAFFLPGSIPLTVAGGFAFGVAQAAIYAAAGTVMGGCAAFLLARYFLGFWLQRTYGERLRRFNGEMERNGHLYLITLRIAPFFPSFALNFLAGLTRISFRTFLWTTVLGIMPGTIVYAFAGRQLRVMTTPSDILTPGAVAVFILLAVMTLLPAAAIRLRRRAG